MSGLARASSVMAACEPLAVQTATVYWLADDATHPPAVARIYAAKRRPSLNPLIVQVPDVATAETIGVFDADARALAGSFWPGPLTLVVRSEEHTSELQSLMRISYAVFCLKKKT